MSTQKIAVLHSTLLVRKGEARPSRFDASSPSTVAWLGDTRPPAIADSGEEGNVGRPRAMAPVELAPAALSGAKDSATGRQRTPTSTPSGRRRKGRRVALTLRLDAECHRRLRIFSACAGRSIQDVLTTALDDYLARNTSAVVRECPCLGAAAPPSGKNPDETS